MTEALLFTIDVEEFTLPAEYGIPFDEERAYALGCEGLERLSELLDRFGIQPTLFVTAAFARRFPKIIASMASRGSEIALHALEHVHDYQAMPAEESRRLLGIARDELRSLFNAPVDGYRANCFRAPSQEVIRALGFRWTSNLHPAWVLGAYDNSKRPREIHDHDGVIEVPVSATRHLRLPLSWFWMRNLGLAYTKAAAARALDGLPHLHVYIHPWEAADLPRLSGLPLKGRLSMRKTGAPFLRILDGFLSWCRTRGLESRTISTHLEQTGWLKTG